MGIAGRCQRTKVGGLENVKITAKGRRSRGGKGGGRQIENSNRMVKYKCRRTIKAERKEEGERKGVE